MAGEGLPLVGRLLGHSRHRTTAGYAHLADAYLVEAAEKVGAVIAAAMAGGRPPVRDPRARRRGGRRLRSGGRVAPTGDPRNGPSRNHMASTSSTDNV